MTKILLLLIFTLGLLSCSQTTRESEYNTTDSSSMPRIVINEYESASIYRDLESDSLLAGKEDFAKFTEYFTKGTVIKEMEYEGGDCSGRFKQMSLGTDTLTVDKYDCGDYGFGNTEFITDGDSLQYTRAFKMEWSPDEKGNNFIVSETIYEFSTNAVTMKTRNRAISGWKNFKLENTHFEQSRSSGAEEYLATRRKLADLVSEEN